MMAALAVAFLFPNAGYAAAVGVTISGVLQYLQLMFATRRAGIATPPLKPKWDADTRQFFRALGPAVIGSAGVQIAMFADTIISSLLPTGGPSSIYYADRIYQLPIGVIGIAAGTVLLPEMSRAISGGAPDAAIRAQNRTMALTIALAAPFFVAFLAIPDLIMHAVFVRGRFTLEEAHAAARVLGAYDVGLLAIVLIASARASFQARGDTTTPMVASLTAVALNVGLKLVLYKPYGAPGLAFATAIGAWINFGILVALALRAGFMQPNSVFAKVVGATAAASFALFVTALLSEAPTRALAAHAAPFAAETQLVVLGVVGMIVYVAAFLVAGRIVGLDLSALRGGRRRAKPAAEPKETGA